MVHLTPREFQVAQLLAQGLRNKEIGARLGITEGAVKNICRTLYDKAGMSNRTELALWYVAHEKDIDHGDLRASRQGEVQAVPEVQEVLPVSRRVQGLVDKGEGI